MRPLGAPNVAKLLERGGVDYVQRTGGAHKRTLNVFSPNTEEGLQKFEEEIGEIFDRAGKFHGAEGQTSCTTCAEGKYQIAKGQTTCAVCDYQCAAGTSHEGCGGPSAGKCNACAPGQFKRSDSTEGCVACGSGHHQSARGRRRARVVPSSSPSRPMCSSMSQKASIMASSSMAEESL